MSGNEDSSERKGLARNQKEYFAGGCLEMLKILMQKD